MTKKHKSFKRSKKRKLEKKLEIIPFHPSKNSIGHFISYCKLPWHPGILHEEKAKDCMRKGCYHYLRFYELNMYRRKK